MNTVFRLYTEDVNRDGIAELARKVSPGFTLIPAIGFWEGAKEQSLIVEFILDIGGLNAPCQQAESVKEFAIAVKELNCQQCVLVTRQEISGLFI